MTEFLTRLAARSLGRAPVVQPRLLSRFEAAPAVSEPVEMAAPTRAAAREHQAPSGDPTAQVERGLREWSDENQPPQPLSAQPSQRDSPAVRTGATIVHQVVGMAARSPEPIPPRVAASRKPDRSETPIETPRARATPIATTAAVDQAPSPQLSRNRPTAEAPAADRITEPAPPRRLASRRSAPQYTIAPVGRDQATAVPPTAGEDVSGPLPPLLPDPRRAIAHVGPDQTSVFPAGTVDDISAQTPPPLSDPSVAIAHLGPSKVAALPRAAEDRNAPAVPVVRVSIGRIEVHAVTAPAATPPPRAGRRAAGPSLDEYLKERGARA